MYASILNSCPKPNVDRNIVNVVTPTVIFLLMEEIDIFYIGMYNVFLKRQIVVDALPKCSDLIFLLPVVLHHFLPLSFFLILTEIVGK